METMNTETWTADDSRALDEFAKRQPNRVPLQRDEKLWDLLAEYRPATVTDLPRCSVCNTLMRPFAAPKSLYPDTIARGANGLCMTHYKRRRSS